MLRTKRDYDRLSRQLESENVVLSPCISHVLIDSSGSLYFPFALSYSTFSCYYLAQTPRLGSSTMITLNSLVSFTFLYTNHAVQ